MAGDETVSQQQRVPESRGRRQEQLELGPLPQVVPSLPCVRGLGWSGAVDRTHWRQELEVLPAGRATVTVT